MNGKTFILGHATATHKVTVTNTLDFGGANRTIQVNDGAAAVDAEISGVLQPQAAATDIGLTKAGTGTLLLSNSNTLNGTIAINGGTLIITGANQSASAVTFSGGGKLGLDIASPVTATSATVDFTGQQVLVTGSPVLASYTLLTASSIIGEPTLASPISGYELDADGTTLKLVSTGAPTGFAAWQTANSTAGTRDQDHDNDGVDNGTEHFLGGTANTTGFTTLPTVVDTAGTLSVTWTKAASYTGTYNTDYVVETSATLAGPWTTETLGGNVAETGNDVKYTFPGGPAYSGKNFARLKVTGP
jgi:autotransporter-associated beta strand protein